MPLLGEPNSESLVRWLKHLPATLPKPKGIVIASAHWEERNPTVITAANPKLLYDYYGFPPESYTIKYPAPGDKALASKVQQLLRASGFKPDSDPDRGLDHGVFVPLKLMYPEADVPVVELSILSSLDPEEHIRLGEALAPLREEGVLVVGSGSSFHNMQVFMGVMRGGLNQFEKRSEEFDSHMSDVVSNKAHTPEERRNLFINWAKWPQARFAHPREEHFLPLLVAAGAANLAAGEVAYNDIAMGAKLSGYVFQ